MSNTHSEQGDQYTTITDGPPFRLNLPISIVRDSNIGIESTENTEVSVSTEWTAEGIVIIVRSIDNGEDNGVRRAASVTHSDGHKRCKVAYPAAPAAALGLSRCRVGWQVDSSGQVLGTVVSDTRHSVKAPIAALPYRTETITKRVEDPPEDKPMARCDESPYSLLSGECPRTVGDVRTLITEEDRTYAETDAQDRTIAIREKQSSRSRLVLRNDQSRSMRFIPDAKPTIVANELNVVYLIEDTPDGLLFILHPKPDAVPDRRKISQTVTSVTINNWRSPTSSSETFGDKYRRARNQISINCPENLIRVFGLVGVEMQWWPTWDRLYGSNVLVLVGRRADGKKDPSEDVAVDRSSPTGIDSDTCLPINTGK